MASKLACKRAWSARGFTLIELMIVAAIVAILAVLAYPSYVQYVVRSNRAATESFMQEVAAAQERFLLDNRAYAPDLPTLQYASSIPASVAANYQLSFSGVTTSPPAYTLNATPTGSQASSDSACGTLGLSNTGNKTASGVAANCWK